MARTVYVPYTPAVADPVGLPQLRGVDTLAIPTGVASGSRAYTMAQAGAPLLVFIALGDPSEAPGVGLSTAPTFGGQALTLIPGAGLTDATVGALKLFGYYLASPPASGTLVVTKNATNQKAAVVLGTLADLTGSLELGPVTAAANNFSAGPATVTATVPADMLFIGVAASLFDVDLEALSPQKARAEERMADGTSAAAYDVRCNVATQPGGVNRTAAFKLEGSSRWRCFGFGVRSVAAPFQDAPTTGWTVYADNWGDQPAPSIANDSGTTDLINFRPSGGAFVGPYAAFAGQDYLDDIAAPAGMPAGSAVRVTFPAGFPAGESPVRVFENGAAASPATYGWAQAQALNAGYGYIGTYLQLPPGFNPAGIAGLKIFYYGPPSGINVSPQQNHIPLILKPGTGSRLLPAFETQNPFTTVSEYTVPDTDENDINDGQAHEITVYWEPNTPGTANGILRIRVDGRLELNKTNALFFAAGQIRTLGGFNLSPYFGGGVSPTNDVPQTQYLIVGRTRLMGRLHTLQILTQPAGAVDGVALTTQPQVRVLDPTGAVANLTGVQITATLTGPGGSIANATASTVNGVATWSGLAVDATTAPSSGHQLVFSVPGLVSVTSVAFDVASPGGGFAPPDIWQQDFENASAATGLDSQMTAGWGVLPSLEFPNGASSRHLASATGGISGSRCLDCRIAPGGPNYVPMGFIASPRSSMYVRFYFRTSVNWDLGGGNNIKFLRWHTTQGDWANSFKLEELMLLFDSLGGQYVSLGMAWGTPSSWKTRAGHLCPHTNLANNQWHSLEWQMQVLSGPTRPQFRSWVDGLPTILRIGSAAGQFGTDDPTVSYVNPGDGGPTWIRANGAQGNATYGGITFVETLSSTSQTGSLFIDRIAYSTQRIGP